jgi:hypothetical protein
LNLLLSINKTNSQKRDRTSSGSQPPTTKQRTKHKTNHKQNKQTSSFFLYTSFAMCIPYLIYSAKKKSDAKKAAAREAEENGARPVDSNGVPASPTTSKMPAGSAQQPMQQTNGH